MTTYLPNISINSMPDPRQTDLSMEELYMEDSTASTQAITTLSQRISLKDDIIRNFSKENAQLRAVIAQLQQEKLQQAEVQSSAPLSLAEGRKCDLVKVLAALSASGIFRLPDGSKASQKYIMEQFGTILGEDMTNYSQTLSEAKKRADADGNNFLQTFVQLTTWAEKYLNT